MARVVITGKKGQLVNSLEVAFLNTKYEICKIGRPEIDFTNLIGLKDKLSELQPDIIISAAAFTNVDGAETDYKNAKKVNEIAPKLIAELCNDLAIPLIHISTDFVFSGNKTAPYNETDAANPISVYGETKLAGEKAIASQASNYVILRTSWVFSQYGDNFVKSMVKLAQNKDLVDIVSDQIGCPNNANDLAVAIVRIADKILIDNSPNLRGIFHLSGTNYISRARFADEIFEVMSKIGFKTPKVNHITSDEFPSVAKRPKNSRLYCQKLKKIYNIEIPDWKISLQECVKNIINEVECI